MSAVGRLTKPAQFALVFRDGRGRADDLLVLKALPNGLSETRVGISVSRRVGNAVTRNRVKRRLRESVRQAEIAPGWDVLIIARTPVGGAGYRQVSEALAKLLARAGLSAVEK